ncbi:MAG: ABC transporter ATP-binding protein [Acidobacteriales bacterium]|nr:ABC transporter ATP-binding protein [Terriglobales bacterium]
MNAIEISGLSKRYASGFQHRRSKVALQALDLQVSEGETFGFLGPNGAGKTTTLKILMGLLRPSSGWARILGMELDDPRMKAQIGFLPEQPYFYDYLTARELLRYYGTLSGMASSSLDTRIAEVLARVGVASSANLPLRKLSKGMLQRVGIGQAVLHDPRVLFLDEPMSGLDPMGQREVRDLIEALKAEGKTVFFSTHILSDAEALCDRVAVLHEGQLRGVGVVFDLLASTEGKVEVTWKGQSVPEELRSLSGEIRHSGPMTRALIRQGAQDRAIDALREARLEIVSVTPVRASLEDYFMGRVEAAQSDEVRR